jgi:phospholipid/cholesterol/gamma-HCH transport system ATP-binding protein
MDGPIISIRDLTSGYGDKIILEDISLDIFPRQITVILGTSGCGKTTLLKHLIGLLMPAQGSIKLFGQEIKELDEKELNQLLQKIGVLFQNGALLASLPLSENLAIPYEQHTNLPHDLIEHLVRSKLHLVELDHAYDYLPSELSGGMRKRAALARAIALDPLIFFADEPAAGLDPVTAASLDKLLLSLKEKLGMTLVVVTHETASIKRIANRAVYLHEGRILFDGSIDEALISDIPQVKAFFADTNN